VRVLPSPCYIISDAHLGVASRPQERELRRFLRHIRDDARSLVVNGDLFDFWFEWRSVIPRAGFRVLASLADLADSGVKVLWVAGNHDCWGGEIIREDAGVDFHVGSWRGEVAGWQARIDHGDGLRDAEDRRYRAMRSVLRHPWAIRAFRWIHPDLGTRLALGSSHASRTYKARDGGEGLRMVAHRDLAADRELELLVFGHSHVPTLERTPSGSVYANAGTWMDDTTYLRLDPERIALYRWEGGESSEITTLQRDESAANRP
jgi:UDP-2,3-diacylglucosamine hydrolase